MSALDNVDVARLLSETADLLELREGNPFKVRAYRRAALLIELLPEPVADLLVSSRSPDQVRRLSAGQRQGPHLLAGVEVDILADGRLDLPPEVLGTLDCVVASIHSRFAEGRDRMTERLVRACRSGVVHILGPPTGRQLGMRDAYELDLARVFEAARQAEVAVEINAMPDRLDLGAEACRQAKSAGVTLVISTDAHHESQLSNLRFGVWMARRGWLERTDVLNTLPFAEVRRRRIHPRGAARGPEAHTP